MAIRDNLETRIVEPKGKARSAKYGLHLCCSGAEDELVQIGAALQRRTGAVTYGMPTFDPPPVEHHPHLN
ncbi:hypothetical protein [Kibdelosporangium phytohabitans]|uniref:Uncharacterized protein n=1 Tax=Kibdelosporangium phytohabitans TaxID=860235 RepID=A0A0N9HMW4_9PSEU|nr:hypothetical protein [Kibdelosporangium phytohabitans]ALG08245.1 hypothetical protein AOZ06_16190 [Kibdelosporangium phytohabitans]MBE1470745.1 hypothetical protein [Kibdelosporangium phytohabitans]